MMLSRKQVESILMLFNEGVIIDDQIELNEDRGSGIGVNTYVRYVDGDLRIKQVDITEYEKW